jgi:subtilisin family serine protease
MRIRSIAIAVLLVTLAAAAPSASAAERQPAWVPGQLLVKYKNGGGPDVGKHGVKKAKKVFGKFKLKGKALQNANARGLDRVYLVELDADDIEPALRKLAADPKVEYVQPNHLLELKAVPNDPSFASQWAMTTIGAPQAWDSATSGSGVVVGVVDTGIATTHPDLASNIWVNPGEVAGNGLDDDDNGFVDDVHGWNFAGDNADVTDVYGHGTHIAGIIGAAGNNGAGVAGVNWTAKLAALRIGGSIANVYAAVQAVEYANMMGFKVTSNSYGWKNGGQQFLFDDVIAAAEAAGHLFVVAAGNESQDNDVTPSYPAHYTSPNVISVTATSNSDALSVYADWGANSVDLAAPGDNILSTLTGGTYGTMTGTSMATPFVAGAAALLWTAQPSLTAAQVRDELMLTSQPLVSLHGKTVSGGRLSLANLFDGDAVAPAAVTDLAITNITHRSMTVRFTATGDDGTAGNAARYDVRVSTSPITSANFAAATQLIGEPMPQGRGMAEAFRLTSLAAATTYYAAVRVLDNAANASALSNVVAFTTARVAVVFEDNMNGGARDWTIEGTNGIGGPALWNLGIPMPWEPNGYNDKMWRYNNAPPDNANGTYDTGARNWGGLISREIDLTQASESRLRFRQYLWTERHIGYDMGQVQISADGGPWTTLLSKNFTLYDWASETLDLSMYDGRRIRLRFFFDTIDARENNYTGWSVDDVVVDASSTNAPPVAANNGPYTIAEDALLTLSAAGSTDPEGAALEYKWEFGDGTFAYTRNTTVQHAWKLPGTYAVKLTAFDGANASDPVTVTVTATPVNDRPTVSLEMWQGNPPPYYEETQYRLWQTSVDEEGSELNCRWDFGDGETRIEGRCQVSALHAWNRPGPVRATVIVNDGQLDSLPATVDITILENSNDRPVAKASPATQDATLNTAVTFNGTASFDEETSIASYLWTFPDGTTSTLAQPLKSFGSSGKKDVTLRVTDTTGLQSDPVTVSVNVCGNASANLFVATEYVCVGDSGRVPVSINGTDSFGPWTVRWTDGVQQTFTPPLSNGYYAERVVPSQQRTYALSSITDRMGCPGTVNTATTAIDFISATLPTYTETICPDQTVRLYPTLKGTWGPFTLTWNDGYVQTMQSGNEGRDVSPSATTTYSIVSVRVPGCSPGATGVTSGAVTVKVNAPPAMTVTGGGLTCPGVSVRITGTLTSGELPVDAQWSDSVWQPFDATRIVERWVTPSVTTTYTAYPRTGFCNGTSTGSAIVRIGAPAITTQPQSKTIAKNTSTTLTVAVAEPGMSYQWYQGAAGTTTTPVGTNSPSFTTPKLRSTTSYWVRVVKPGCTTQYATNSQTAVITAK